MITGYLFDQQPIVANKTLAKYIGLIEALLLQQINYWIEINKKTGKNFYDEKYWTYNSIRAWHENDFDYLSYDTVKRTFAKLEKAGFLLVGNYNKDPRDRTKWYTINEKKLEELYTKIEADKKQKEEEALKLEQERTDQEIVEEPSNFNNPNALGQNAPMGWGKEHLPIGAKCTNGLGQNAPTITRDYYKDYYKDLQHPSSHHPFSHHEIEQNENRGGGQDSSDSINISHITPNKKTYNECLEELRKNTDYYEHMKLGNKIIASSYDEILKILAEVMILDANSTITINQTKMQVGIVQEKFKKLNSSHLDYLVEILRNNKSEIRNVRSFLLTVAYNAFSNIDAYYTAKTNYELKQL